MFQLISFYILYMYLFSFHHYCTQVTSHALYCFFMIPAYRKFHCAVMIKIKYLHNRKETKLCFHLLLLSFFFFFFFSSGDKKDDNNIECDTGSKASPPKPVTTPTQRSPSIITVTDTGITGKTWSRKRPMTCNNTAESHFHLVADSKVSCICGSVLIQVALILVYHMFFKRL